MKKNLYTLLVLCCSITAHAQWTTICNTGNGFVVDMSPVGSDIYSTGFYTRDCGTNANYINKWDGTTTTAVGTGLPDPGHRISNIGSDRYVAKYEQAVDTNWVYKWDGTNYVKFGAPVYLTTAVAGFSKTPSIYDIVEYRGDIIISGEFDWADGKHISGVARWTGSTWDSLGTGLGGYLTPAPSNVMYPHQMMVYQDTLYVVGNFVTAGGTTVNGVAKWDGIQWHAMDDGFNQNVYAIAVYNSEIYAAGGFTKTGTTTMRHIAKWNGSSWVSPGFDVYTNATGFDEAYIHTLKSIGSRLFISGGFLHVTTSAGITNCNNIIAWDGTTVSTLSGGTPNYQIEAIAPWGTNGIIVGGGYNNDSSYVAKYDLTALDVPATTAPQLSVYPIPATDVLHLSGIVVRSAVTITDMTGRTVYEDIAGNSNFDIDLGKLPGATYLLRVSNPGEGSITRVIVKR